MSFKIKLLNHIFSIFLIALFLVIFEIILFYFIIIPQLKQNISRGIQNIINVLNNNDIKLSINNIVDDLIDKIFENNNDFIDDFNNNIDNKINNIKEEIKQEIRNTIKQEIKNMNYYKIEKFEQIRKRRYNTEISDELINKIKKILIKYNIKPDDKLIKYIKLIINTNFDQKFYNILLTLNESESNLIELNNNSLLNICIIFVLSTVSFLIFIHYYVKLMNNIGIDRCTYIHTIIIIILIILFQINFYFFSQKYKYTGNFGDEELLINLLN